MRGQTNLVNLRPRAHRVAAGIMALLLVLTGIAVASAPTASAGTFKYALPWSAGKSYRITQSPGGSYSHNDSYNRTAVDFALPSGTPVLASQTGIIYFEGWNGPAGIEARIQHAGGGCTQYAHLSRTIVDKGQRVLRGQVIGYSGGSGYGSQSYYSPHLHWAGVDCATYKSTSVISTVERGTSYVTNSVVTSANSGADLRNPKSGRCLDIAGASTADGARIQLYDCNRSKAQTWINEPQSNSRIRGLGGTKCLDISGGVIQSGTKVQSYRCNGSSAQKWTVRADGTIRPTANTSLCLDAVNGGTANGTRIQLYKCTSGNTAQQWG